MDVDHALGGDDHGQLSGNLFTCFPDAALLVPALLHVVRRRSLVHASLYRVTAGQLQVKVDFEPLRSSKCQTFLRV